MFMSILQFYKIAISLKHWKINLKHKKKNSQLSGHHQERGCTGSKLRTLFGSEFLWSGWS